MGGVDHPGSDSTFPKFPLLPWELRRMIWEFSLPRSFFTSAVLCSRSYVPYPTISLVCHEALLVVEESGSMVTAWDRDKLRSTIGGEPITNDTDLYIRTWLSSKLDTFFLNFNEIRVPKILEDASHRCDLVDIRRSPNTRLVVPNSPARWGPRLVNQVYQKYLKGRQDVLLSIGAFELVLKKEAWDNDVASQLLGAVGTGTRVIHLDDTAALRKYFKLWEHCCQVETRRSWYTRHSDFETWLKMATDEGKGGETRGWMRKYKAWIVERQGYEKRPVAPEVYFTLRIADHLIAGHGLRPNPRRGHEIVDSTGRLKEDHPLVRNLDIKLPEVVPVCTISILRSCRCEQSSQWGLGTIRRLRGLIPWTGW